MAQIETSAGLWGSLASLLLAALVVMGSPGPSTTSLTAIGAAFGWRRALPYGVGLVLGTVAVLVAVAAGTASTLAALPGLAPGAEAALKVAALATMIGAIHAAWLVAGAALSRALSDPVLSRRLNLAFAALLVVSTAMALL